MGKNKEGAVSKDSGKTPSKRKRAEVTIISCPSDFPTLNSGPKSAKSGDSNNLRKGRSDRNDDSDFLLDWNDTTRQVRQFASSAFEGKTKRQYKEEEYERLTGRKMKQQHVPQQIQRGINKKARERHAKQVEEAKLNGIVLPTVSTKKKDNKGGGSYHDGPAPSIGYMKQGVYRVKNDRDSGKWRRR